MVDSQPQPLMLSMAKCPHDIMTYNTLCFQVTAYITQTYTPPESFPLEPLLPIPYIIQ